MTRRPAKGWVVSQFGIPAAFPWQAARRFFFARGSTCMMYFLTSTATVDAQNTAPGDTLFIP